ncbi:MAG: hypothetical protein ACLTST_02425 [Lachnospiraceae bacterium]
MSEATAKEDGQHIRPNSHLSISGKSNVPVNAETVEIRSLECDSIELDVKTPYIALADVSGTVEVNCNLGYGSGLPLLKWREWTSTKYPQPQKFMFQRTLFLLPLQKGLEQVSLMRKTDGRRNASTRPMRRISLN